MVLSPRISLKKLSDLCRRLAMSLEAGIDARRMWAREIERASFRDRPKFALISDAIERGETTAAALAETGDFFPPLFHDMAEVGELSGHQSEVFAQLAEHFTNQLAMRRSFLSSLTWPMFQLGSAITIIGLLIWVMGLIGNKTGVVSDPLGFGLVGNSGLMIYVLLVGTIAAGIAALVIAWHRGLGWTRPIQRAVLKVPALGSALQTLALARMAWSMHLSMGAGMEIRHAMRLSLRSTGNAHYTDQITFIRDEITRGNSLHEALVRAGGYPVEFLDALAVGEQTGKLVESMGLLSRQYTERSRAALATLTTIAGYAVWACVATIIIILIFRLFGSYLGMIQGAMPK
jgi:type IV pilus assembly protein PilC